MSNHDLHHLKDLRKALPRLLETVAPGTGSGLDTWCHVLDVKLLSRLGPDFPLVAAVCGGGSSGKSTLVNSLAGSPVSPVGGTAGLNRRVLLAFHPRWLKSDFFLAALEETLDTGFRQLEDPGQLKSPGPPLYAALESMPQNLVLLDTPDFDTGARGVYTNREAARRWLETADLLIYVFTNSNYANRDNTDFLRGLLTGTGTRPSLLVYRAYPGLEDGLVKEHARQVGQNIYGAESRQMVLGIFRADEDNAVAEGKKPVTVRPVDPGDDGIIDRLAALDVASWRQKTAASALADVLDQARKAAARAAGQLEHLDLYRQGLRALQSRCVTRALSHFPSDRVLGLFTRIWLASDPPHVRFMRRTGHVVEWPLARLSRAVKQIGKRQPVTDPGPAAEGQLVEADLLRAADRLVRGAAAPTLTVEVAATSELARMADHPRAQVRPAGKDTIRFAIDLPECLAPRQQELAAIDRGLLNRHLAEARDDILQPSRQLEAELEKLAGELRSRMGLLAQLRQTASAMLNVLPATAAVTYILSTGDPVGAATIKVKLTGLFGLKDLYALIAIPATSGLKKADRDQLRQVLEPVARRWLDNKLAQVERLFEKEITGGILRAADRIHQEGRTLLEKVEGILDSLEREAKP